MTEIAADAPYVITGTESLDFVPFAAPEVGGDGMAEFGEAALVRTESYNGNPLFVGFWRSEPATSPLYDVPLGDESGYVVTGRATIELLDSGRTVELGAGQCYTFRKGTLTRWTIHEPFVKFVVVNDGPPAQG